MADDSILALKKQRGRWLVELASGESFHLPSALLRAYPLDVGQPFDRERYAILTARAGDKLALERAARLLEQRDYSARTLRGKLIDAGFSPQSADRACAYLQDRGFLDDRRYALQLMAREKKRSGSRKIGQKLREKGLNEELARQVLGELSEEDELAAATAQAEKYLKNKRLEPLEARRKTIAMLARRGFSYSLAEKAASAALSGKEEEGSSS